MAFSRPEGWRDFTCSFAQMYGDSPERAAKTRQMYSYDRPAYLFWSAFMNGLMAAGYSEAAATEWLCSKAARWALDGELGDAIEELAFTFARDKGGDYFDAKQCELWACQTARAALKESR